MDVMVRHAARCINERSEADMQVLPLSDRSEQEGKAATTSGTVAVGALTLEQKVIVASSHLYLVNGDSCDCSESRSGAGSAA